MDAGNRLGRREKGLEIDWGTGIKEDPSRGIERREREGRQYALPIYWHVLGQEAENKNNG